MNSLRLRLVVLLSIGLGIAWVVSAWFTYSEARHEIDELFDAQLAESAQVLLGTATHELHEQIERGDDQVAVSHEYEQKLAFQVWNNNNLLLRSIAAPVVALTEAKPGYSEIKVNNEAWRALVRWDAQHEFMIQVAEPMAGREHLARHITLKLLLPTFIALPVLALLIWLGVGAGLRPLSKLKQEVRRRTANRLEPVAMAGVPEEVAPLTLALNELFARLQQAFESERRFTADAAHELRTPLAALKIQAQVALRSTDETERKNALENVLRGTDRATRLVEQLLTLARVDPEAAVAGYRQVDLRALATNVMVDIAPLAHAKQIEMVLEEKQGSNAERSVLGDEVQLGLLLRNLIDNAIRYTPVGGRVSVGINTIDGIALEVRDSGPGIPESERDQVQQRFYRIAGSGEEGSGLGLSIVRRIAELHGARLALSDNNSSGGLLAKVYW
ncbi:sensor protein QseC [mine drainage metagenome]|uniref:histidine kinase n=1 Tax=mine drainage metagenome TaxID=410659 RepID=A0A1J5QYY7_9ZZZZ